MNKLSMNSYEILLEGLGVLLAISHLIYCRSGSQSESGIFNRIFATAV